MIPDMSFDNKSALWHYHLELLFCSITPAVKKQSLIDVMCADGQLDLLEGMGEPRYGFRTVTAHFKALSNFSETVDRLVNDLEGRSVDVVLPDKLDYFVTGMVHVQAAGPQDGAEIHVTVVCLPWRYARHITTHEIPASASGVTHVLRNGGNRAVVPTIVVAGTAITVTTGGKEIDLAVGTHLVPDLMISGRGEVPLTIRGGTAVISYREAIL